MKKELIYKNLLVYATALIICFSILTVLLRGVDLSIPLSYSGDGLLNSLWVKSIIDNGWYLHNELVGAPFGLDMQDFAMADNFHLLIIKMITLFSSNFALVMNTFYLLTYPLTVITSLFVMRSFKFSNPTAIVASLLYAFMPYHFLRGENHLFLASYYMIPLLVMVVLWAWEKQWNKNKLIVSFIICLLISATGIYYAFFACFLISFVAVNIAVQSRSFKVIFIPFTLICVISVGALLNLSPSLLYKVQHGSNQEVGNRSPSDAEIYGLKITNLLMPIENHRISLFAKIRMKYDKMAPLNNENRVATLGIIGGIGFLLLIIYVFGRNVDEKLKRLSYLNLSTILLSAIGGFGSIFSLAILSEIRGYNRISIIIAFFSIFSFFYVFDKWVKKHDNISITILGGLLLIGILDQTNGSFKLQGENTRIDYRNDANYIKSLESILPDNSMIFQLPYVPFPENPPVNKMIDYEHLKAYLHSSHLRWSYASMRGRSSDLWVSQVSYMQTNEMVENITLAGFNGIYINRDGYVDHGDKIEKEISSIIDVEPIVSQDKKVAFYSLLEYNERLKLKYIDMNKKKDETLHPIFIKWGIGFYGPELDESGYWRWSDAASDITLENTSNKVKTVTISMTIASGFPKSSVLEISGAINDNITYNNSGQYFSAILNLEPGKHSIRFKSNAEKINAPTDNRNLFFQIKNFKMVQN